MPTSIMSGNFRMIKTTLLFFGFLAVLNETYLNVSLRTFMQVFDVSISVVQWLTTGFMLVMTVVVPISAFFYSKLYNQTDIFCDYGPDHTGNGNRRMFSKFLDAVSRTDNSGVRDVCVDGVIDKYNMGHHPACSTRNSHRYDRAGRFICAGHCSDLCWYYIAAISMALAFFYDIAIFDFGTCVRCCMFKKYNNSHKGAF
ncbi:hypothetical protein SAMN05660900_02681 [Megasphaera cerevisiae DSM 20462]|nr:hypothetical protein SAMN05660900_02681 [Megasphaera cerevisiae DSM 20462]